MKWTKRAVFSGAAVCLGCLLVPAAVQAADWTNGITEFSITYLDSSGLVVSYQDIESYGPVEDGMIALDPDLLVLPDGFEPAGVWWPDDQLPCVTAGEDLTLELPVAAIDPQIETLISRQKDNPQTMTVSALMLNYRTSEGTLLDSQTFFIEDLWGAAGTTPYHVMSLDWDYVVDPPEGYSLSTPVESKYEVLRKGRLIVDLQAEPSETSAPLKDSEEGNYTGYITYYEVRNQQAVFLSAQHIPFFGDGRITLSEDLLEFPPGLKLRGSWPMKNPYVSNANLAVHIMTTSAADGAAAELPSVEKDPAATGIEENAALWLCAALSGAGALAFLSRPAFSKTNHIPASKNSGGKKR